MESKDPKQYWEDRLASASGLEGVGYTVLGEAFNTWMYKVRRRVFSRALRRSGFDARGANILDIGSGTGFYLDRWVEAGSSSVVGSDITKTAVAQLRSRYSQRIIELDIGDPVAELPQGPFDAVSAFDVLFHIIDDKRFTNAIGNIASLVAPGGYFFLSDNFLRAGEHRGPYQVSRKLTDIQTELRSAGFEPILRRPMFVLMNAPVDTRSERLKSFWKRVTTRIKRDPSKGDRYGRLLYPIEILLTWSLREGPSTEIMVCRKVR